jgi:hypothetical protein
MIFIILHNTQACPFGRLNNCCQFEDNVLLGCLLLNLLKLLLANF